MVPLSWSSVYFFFCTEFCCSFSHRSSTQNNQRLQFGESSDHMFWVLYSQKTSHSQKWILLAWGGRVLLTDVEFSAANHSIQAAVPSSGTFVGLRIESETTWENKWRHHVTIAYNLPKHDEDWEFGFNQYEYESVFRLTPNSQKSSYWLFQVWMQNSSSYHFKISGRLNCAMVLLFWQTMLKGL